MATNVPNPNNGEPEVLYEAFKTDSFTRAAQAIEAQAQPKDGGPVYEDAEGIRLQQGGCCASTCAHAPLHSVVCS
jgi:hypothetical protein